MKSVLAICTPIPFIKQEDYVRMGPITPQWHRCRMNIAQPMGYNVAELYMDGLDVDEARNRAVELAIEHKYRYMFFLDWDVLVPATVLRKLVYLADTNPDRYVFGGIYPPKQMPAEPILWRKEYGCGISWDWKVGDIINDAVGIGCGMMLIRLSVFEKLSKPWFKTEEHYVARGDGTEIMEKSTEDLYFCKKVIEETGKHIMVDASLIGKHIDNFTGCLYELDKNTPPFRE